MEPSARINAPQRATENSQAQQGTVYNIVLQGSKKVVAVAGAGLAGVTGMVGTAMTVGPTVALAAGAMQPAPTSAAVVLIGNLVAASPTAAFISSVVQGGIILGAWTIGGGGLIFVGGYAALSTYSSITTYLNPPLTEGPQNSGN